MLLPRPGFANAYLDQSDDRVLRTRVSVEVREMPGLRITLAQASRLFSVDPAPWERSLQCLVDVGELSTDGRVFARAGTGRRYA